jgi:hypothetical protein
MGWFQRAKKASALPVRIDADGLSKVLVVAPL